MIRTTHIARGFVILTLSFVAIHEAVAQPNVVLGTEVYEGEQNADTGWMPVYAQTYSYAEGSGAENVQLYVQMDLHNPSGPVMASNSNQWYQYISTTAEVWLHPDTVQTGVYDAVGAVSWDYWGSMQHVGCQTNKIGFGLYGARYYWGGCDPNTPSLCYYFQDECNHPCQSSLTVWGPGGDYLQIGGFRVGVDWNHPFGTFSTRRCTPGWRRLQNNRGDCVFIDVP